MKFSANLGFLWADRPLPEAIRAAKAAGFDAVELHWPYDTPAAEIATALRETGLPCLGLNTRRGDVARGDNGLAAIPGRETEACAAIDEAVAFAAAIDAQAVHVMAGVAEGAAATAAFVANLRYARDRARPHGIGVLIEPLNAHDAPGYFLRTTAQAVDILDTVGGDGVSLMFDCYHVARTEGDVTRRLSDLVPRIGHIQIASVPDRGAPDHGALDYGHVFRVIADLGYDRPLGAEYKPGADTDATLGWLAAR